MSDAFAVRAPRPEDLAAVLDLQNAVDISEYGQADSVVSDLQAEWQRRRFNLETDAWVVEPRAAWPATPWCTTTEASSEFMASFYVRPAAAAGSAPALLGPRLLARIESRAREIHAAVAPDDKATISCFCPSMSRLRQGFLEGARYKPARSFIRMAIEMRKGPPTPTRVEGVSIRPFRRNADAEAVWALINESFQDQLPLRGQAVRRMEAGTHRPPRLRLHPLARGLAQEGHRRLPDGQQLPRPGLDQQHRRAQVRPRARRGHGAVTSLNAFFERGQTTVHSVGVV